MELSIRCGVWFSSLPYFNAHVVANQKCDLNSWNDILGKSFCRKCTFNPTMKPPPFSVQNFCVFAHWIFKLVLKSTTKSREHFFRLSTVGEKQFLFIRSIELIQLFPLSLTFCGSASASSAFLRSPHLGEHTKREFYYGASNVDKKPIWVDGNRQVQLQQLHSETIQLELLHHIFFVAAELPAILLYSSFLKKQQNKRQISTANKEHDVIR